MIDERRLIDVIFLYQALFSKGKVRGREGENVLK
jgi:hypothetical protein